MEEMRLMQEIRQVEPPRSLILSNNTTGNIDAVSTKIRDKVSPETLSHRLQKGWQHLEESPDIFLNNNNNHLNDNGNPDDVTLATSLPEVGAFADGEYRAMSSEDDGSSSDEDSSASYSDTSPLLDVSSLCNSSLGSDMSEDSSSSSSDEEDNNNNVEEIEGEEEEVASVDMPSMQSSWMSFSSSASSPSMAGSSRVVLPDVLPKISKMEDEPVMDEASYSNVEINFEKGTEEECCLVEITSQPDVQVDIRVNPISSIPKRESKPLSIKHGNTYPREARNKRYSKTKDIDAWVVNDSFDEHYEEGLNKYCTLGEGIRLNNFTIVNGYKTLSLTELVNPNIDDENVTASKLDSDPRRADTLTSKTNTTHLTNSYQNFERNYSKLPANIHLCCKDNMRFQKNPNNAVHKQRSPVSEIAIVNKGNTNASKPDFEPYVLKSCNEKLVSQKESPSLNSVSQSPGSDSNSNKLMQTASLSSKPNTQRRKENSFFTSKTKTNETKLSPPELFDVYTRESALPHINWAAISKGSRESEWIRKRRNDREEIRRKLAMDSDTEDYISEKLNQHREAGNTFDRLKSTGNLQICFMNESAKDQDNPEEVTATSVQKPAQNLPSAALLKSDKPITKPSSISMSVTKRQRPKFFFNRPRSWHVSKAEEMSDFPEEDLLTRHTRLQAEAREALAQAKDMARMQMEIERQKKKKSPIAEIVGLPFPDGKNMLTHHALVAMNVAQLQVIVNDLHSQIETLNEDLVKFLLERDDLHMEQDSMLVDIEDLTRYLGLKGSGNVSSSSSQLSVNTTSDAKKPPKTDSVRRSQSVHLKSKNLV